MAASAKAILFGTVHHEEIVDFLRQKMGVEAIEVQLHGKDAGNYATLTFHDPVLEGDIRQMTIFGNDLPGYEDVYSGDRTHVSVGARGVALAALTALAETYGGFVLADDSADEWDWIRHDGDGARTPDLSPETRLKIELSAALSPALANEIAEIVLNDPERFQSVLDAVQRYEDSLAAPVQSNGVTP